MVLTQAELGLEGMDSYILTILSGRQGRRPQMIDNVPSDGTPKDGFIRHANLGYKYDASS
jgi:hypothetical protein